MRRCRQELFTDSLNGQGVGPCAPDGLPSHRFAHAPAGLVAALGPTVLLGTASGLLISNAWAVASDRAVKAGKQEGAQVRGLVLRHEVERLSRKSATLCS